MCIYTIHADFFEENFKSVSIQLYVCEHKIMCMCSDLALPYTRHYLNTLPLKA